MFFKHFAFIIYCAIIAVVKTNSTNDIEEYRLSENVIPLSYNLLITPNPEYFNFSGKVYITVDIQFSTYIIKLHSKNLNIKSTRVCQNTQATIKNVCQENEQLIVEFHQAIPHSTKACLVIEFDGVMSDEKKGLYRIPYDEHGEKYRWLAITSFQTTYAREVFPCFDDPRFRTPFSMSIARKNIYITRSNMPRKKAYNENDYIWDQFESTPPIPTYLVAFMIGKFPKINDSHHIIKLWTRKELQIFTKYATKQSEKALNVLQEFTGIPHKLSKLDIMVVPEIKHHLVEAYGMTMFMEYYIISDEERSSQLQKTIVTASICHQLSRHWVGVLVTPLNWNYSWLTEALAGYIEFFVTPLIDSTLKTDEIFNIKMLQPTLWHEITDQRALTWSKKTAAEINEKYGIINYCKGASIIRMLEDMITKRSLRNVLQKFIADGKKLGLVTPRDLYNVLEYQNQMDSFPLPPNTSITEVIKPWIENPGYPLITILRDYDRKMAIIQQSIYRSPRAPKSLPDQEWIVPISYTAKSNVQFLNTTPSIWSFTDKNITIPNKLDNYEWIIINLQQTGHYRVNYDFYNWGLLIKQLTENPEKIHPLNRAQLIDDSFSLAFDDQLPYDIPLKLGEYLTNETEILPLQSAAFHLDMLFNKYEQTKNCILFHKYIKAIFEKQMERIGFDTKETDSYSTKMGRSIVFSLPCKIGLRACIQPALNLYDANIEDISKLHPDQKKLVFCTALQWSDNPQQVYDNLWASYWKSEIAYDKRIILETLGCTRDEELLTRILRKLMQSNYEDITLLDEEHVYKSILSSSKGVKATLTFIRNLIPTLPQVNDGKLASLRRQLDNLHTKIQSETHLRLVKMLENEMGKLDQQKYGDFMKLFHNLRLNGQQTVQKNNKEVNILAPILMDILKIERPQIPSPRKSSTIIIFPSLSLCSFFILVIYKSS